MGRKKFNVRCLFKVKGLNFIMFDMVKVKVTRSPHAQGQRETWKSLVNIGYPASGPIDAGGREGGDTGDSLQLAEGENGPCP